MSEHLREHARIDMVVKRGVTAAHTVAESLRKMTDGVDRLTALQTTEGAQ